MRLFCRLFGVLIFLGILASSALAQNKSFKDLVGPVQVQPVIPSKTLCVPYIFWGGDVATFYANGGLRTAPNSLFEQQGLSIKLLPGDDFPQQVRDYMEGRSPFLRCTMGMLGMASEVVGSDPRTKPVVLFQLTWSKGDHFVAKSHIKKLADLKGKTIVIQEAGPHVKALDDALKLVQLTWSDVKVITCKNMTGEVDSPAALFRQRNDIDAAWVVTPDMIGLTGGLQNIGSGAEGTVKGSHVIASTNELSRSISDVYVCRKDWFDANQDVAYKFTAGYFKSCERIMEYQSSYNSKGSKEYLAVLQMAQDIFGKKSIPTLEEDAAGLITDAVFVGFPGNVVFFNEENNPNGFESQSKESIDLAISLGYAKIRSGFFSASLDYTSKFFVGYLHNTKVDQGDRFSGEALQEEIEQLTNSGALDSNTLISFSIQFQPTQNTFTSDVYGQEFDRVIKALSKAGNGIIAVRGHSDPTKTLSDFVKAGVAKGFIKQSGTPGNYSYYYNGKLLDLADTASIIKIIEDGSLEGPATGINPKDTMQSALNLSRQRAEAVREAIIKYAKDRNIKLDPSQIQIFGVGIKEPLISKPRNMGEASQNMRVEFRLVRVSAEPVKQGDFDF
jgi:hypothetical protein